MDQTPAASRQAVQEFERAIEEGKLPMRFNGIFDEDEETRGE